MYQEVGLQLEILDYFGKTLTLYIVQQQYQQGHKCQDKLEEFFLL